MQLDSQDLELYLTRQELGFLPALQTYCKLTFPYFCVICLVLLIYLGMQVLIFGGSSPIHYILFGMVYVCVITLGLYSGGLISFLPTRASVNEVEAIFKEASECPPALAMVSAMVVEGKPMLASDIRKVRKRIHQDIVQKQAASVRNGAIKTIQNVSGKMVYVKNKDV